MDTKEPTERVVALEELLEQAQARVAYLEEQRAQALDWEQEQQRQLDSMRLEWRREKLELQTRAQSAEDRFYLAQASVGSFAELRERLETAEEVNVLLSVDISDLNAHVLKLEGVIESHEEQIRILQYALDQRVRSALTSDQPSNFEISGPATLEPWPHMIPPPGGWITPDCGRSETSSQAGMDSDMSDRASDAGTECDFRDSSSEFGSFSDVSAPSQDPFDDFNDIGTPRLGSPAPSISPPVTPSSGGDWSEIEADSEEDLDYMSPSPPALDLGMTPFIPSPSASATASSGLHASVIIPSIWDLRNSKETRENIANEMEQLASSTSQRSLSLLGLTRPTDVQSPGSLSPVDPALPEELRARIFPGEAEDKTSAWNRLAQLDEQFRSMDEFEVDITDFQPLPSPSPAEAPSNDAEASAKAL